MSELVAHPPTAPLRGDITVDGDKSISHRALLLATLMDSGSYLIDNILMGEDVKSTIGALRQLGIEIDHPSAQQLRVKTGQLQPPQEDIDCGNSGTLMRLLAGILAGKNIPATLIGDESLMARPMRRIAEPLQAMGARFTLDSAGCPPVQIHRSDALTGMTHRLTIASAQIKSALLFAGLCAEGATTILEPQPTRDHTERMLQYLGVDVERSEQSVTVTGGVALRAADITVPGDLSSAAFFIVAASLVADSEVTIRRVGCNPTRAGILDILQRMGARIERFNERQLGGEPICDLHIRGAKLQATDITRADVALAIDEIPILCIAAAAADGTTRISGAEELRVKETDRIHAMATGLQALGVAVMSKPDGLVITGRNGQSFDKPTVAIDSFGDHRIAMSFAVAAAHSSNPITIRDTRNIATSFPSFRKIANSLGYRLQ